MRHIISIDIPSYRLHMSGVEDNDVLEGFKVG